MEDKIKNNNRNYGIDALRMLAMFLVVTLHILGHGGVLEGTSQFSSQYNGAWLLELAAYCAVDCYALISGFVGVDSKFKLSNLVLLWLRVQFYNIFISLIFIIARPELVDKSSLVDVLFPVMTGTYWYFTAYFGMFFFIPFLNFVLNKMEQKKLKAALLMLVIVFSVLPTFFYRDTFLSEMGSSPWWLMILYLIGGYIKKYGLFEKLKAKVLVLGYLLAVIFTWASKLFLEVATLKFLGESKRGDYFISYISPTILLSAIFLLLIFKSLEIKGAWQKFVKFMAPMSFSVYLIHEQPFIRENYIEGKFSYLSTMPWIEEILLVILIAALIFFSCSIFDLIREKLFKVLKLKQKLQLVENIILKRLKLQ